MISFCPTGRVYCADDSASPPTRAAQCSVLGFGRRSHRLSRGLAEMGADEPGLVVLIANLFALGNPSLVARRNLEAGNDRGVPNALLPTKTFRRVVVRRREPGHRFSRSPVRLLIDVAQRRDRTEIHLADIPIGPFQHGIGAHDQMVRRVLRGARRIGCLQVRVDEEQIGLAFGLRRIEHSGRLVHVVMPPVDPGIPVLADLRVIAAAHAANDLGLNRVVGFRFLEDVNIRVHPLIARPRVRLVDCGNALLEHRLQLRLIHLALAPLGNCPEHVPPGLLPDEELHGGLGLQNGVVFLRNLEVWNQLWRKRIPASLGREQQIGHNIRHALGNLRARRLLRFIIRTVRLGHRG